MTNFIGVYTGYKNGFSIANVRVVKNNASNIRAVDDDNYSDSSWPRKYYFSKVGECETLFAIQEKEGAPFLIYIRQDT